mgnify:FL=1
MEHSSTDGQPFQRGTGAGAREGAGAEAPSEAGHEPRSQPATGVSDVSLGVATGWRRRLFRPGHRTRRRSLLIALVVAIVATVGSGLLYPGGVSRRETAAQGYSITRNYFSDLGMTVSYSGQRNPLGAGLFVVSSFGYGYGAWAFSLLVVKHGRSRRLVGALGVLLGGGVAALGFFLTGLTPKNLLFHLHNWVSYSALLGLLLLWLSASVYLWPGPSRRISVAMVLISAAYLTVLYSRPDWELPADWPLQVIAQKVIVLANWIGLLLGGIGLRGTVSRETDA